MDAITTMPAAPDTSLPSVDFSDLDLRPKELCFVKAFCAGANNGDAAVQAGFSRPYGAKLAKRTPVREAINRVRKASLPPPAADDGQVALLNMRRSMTLLTEIAEQSGDDHARIKAIAKAMDLSGESPQNQLEDVAKAVKVLMEGVKRAGKH